MRTEITPKNTMKALALGVAILLTLAATAFAEVVTFDTQPLGTTWGGSYGQNPGDLIFTEDAIDVSVHEFTLGAYTGFNKAYIDAPITGFGSVQTLRLNNISASFDFSATAAVPDDVYIHFADLGGDENFQVNGGTYYELYDMTSLDGVTVASGVTAWVTTWPIDGGVRGLIHLDGPVTKVLVGGQEFWLDNVRIGEENNPPSECDRLVDHETLTLGTTWGSAGNIPGEVAFTEDGIPVMLGTITLGAYTGFNEATVAIDPMGCLDNQVMQLNNIANIYDVVSAVAATDSVTFDYTDLGGDENLAVNGSTRYEGDLASAPANIAPGVTCTVTTTDYGNYKCGHVTLVGNIQGVLVAGQEFYIDDICVYEGAETPPEECDRLVDNESLILGTEWGSSMGNSPGDLAFTEDGIPVYVEEYHNGVYTGFVEMRVETDYSDCLDNQVLWISNIAALYDISAAVAATDSVTFDFTDYGGEENLQVNGSTLYEVGNLTDLNGTTVAPGVVFFASVDTNNCGSAILVGDVRKLLIGGQEFFVDDVCVYEGEAAPPEECDRLVDHESQTYGTAWGSSMGNSPGDLIFTEDGIPVHLGTITLGAYTGFNEAKIDMDPMGCLDNQVMQLNNISNVYDVFAAVATTDSVTFDFTDFGGEENLAVNGAPRYEGDLIAAPANIAPGVTCTVDYVDYGNYKCGTVTLVGDVGRLLVAGQEFYIDDICVYEGEETPSECDRLSDNESLILGTEWSAAAGYSPGDHIFTEDGIDAYVDEFQNGSGMVFGYLTVNVDPEGCLDNQVLHTNNINVVYDIEVATTPTDSVTFEYIDYGGEENLRVNEGALYQVSSLLSLHGATVATGVICEVTQDGSGCGHVTLIGDVQKFWIGGQEFFVDDVCAYGGEQPPSDCDLEVKFEDEAIGTAWGGPFGNSAGDVVMTEDDIDVYLGDFWDGYNWAFNECFIDMSITGYGVTDGQAMFINNILVGYDVQGALTSGDLVDNVTFEFVDWAGIENLQVNGETIYTGELTSAPVNIATGITCSVDWWPISGGTAAGTVTLTGDVHSFAVGGQQFYMDNVCVTLDGETGVGDTPGAAHLTMGQNYPNPFNPKTTINFSLASAGKVRLTIHDVMGREISRLADGNLEAGSHNLVWEGRDHSGNAVSSGVYFARIEALGEVQSRKLVLSK